jgi:SAM-dependent methyltransferase
MVFLFPTLNLGCGPDSWGDVRIDVGSWNNNANLIMDFDREPIPFPDKFFSECLMNHVLEHSRNPQRLLQEAIRVSQVVHAKYPFKYDRVPFVLDGLSNGRLRLFYHQARALLMDRLTRMGLAESYDTHYWTVGPFGDYRTNTTELFPLKQWATDRRIPTKSLERLLKKILQRPMRYAPSIRIRCEWECWYSAG